MRLPGTAGRAKRAYSFIGFSVGSLIGCGISTSFRQFHLVANHFAELQAISSYCSRLQTISRNFSMPSMSPPVTAAEVVSFDAARQRRHYIDLANVHPIWQEVKASWALEGIELTDDNAEHAGRMIAGDITYVQLIDELRAKYSRPSAE
jgi:hypothetical protein